MSIRTEPTLQPNTNKDLQKNLPGSFSSRLFGFVGRHYVVILMIAGSIIIAEQVREHFSTETVNERGVFFGELIAIVVLLGLIGYLVNVLFTTLTEKTQALNILKIKHDLSQQLTTSQDIPEFSKELARQFSEIVPDANIELYIHEHSKDWYIRVNHAKGDEHPDQHEHLPAGMEGYPCQECMLKNTSSFRSLNACRRGLEAKEPDRDPGFCLPLVYGSSPVGLLLLYSQEQTSLKQEQVKLLGNLSHEIAQAIGMLIEKKAREEALLTEKIRSLQLDIARDLHDTVGQNISYLRMKLDHLSETETGAHQDLIMEIRSMSRVANESYDLVRGTLAVLQADETADLYYLLSRYAEQVSERTAFTIEFTRKGEAQPLSTGKLRHLFYIFREALSNVEKHAQASHVNVNIRWLEKSFEISISDDGKGFDLGRTQKIDMHYGLRFMRERATLLGGTFNIFSKIGKGTEVHVQIPYE